MCGVTSESGNPRRFASNDSKSAERIVRMLALPRNTPFRSSFREFCAPWENSRRAQQGHTKYGKVSYGRLWPDMVTNPWIAVTFAILLWLDLTGYGLRIVVHTGEVQGSIPCASTIKPLESMI
jgi:hypothetical protein